MRVPRYTAAAVVLHLLVAASILFLFVSSWWMLGLPLASEHFQFRAFPFQLHKNVGASLVAFLAVLLWVRSRRRPVPHPAEVVSPRLLRLAMIDHVVLYAVIVACCVSGYLSSSYSGWSTTFWWAVDLPDWGHENEALNQLWSDVHLWTCWILLAAVAVHVAGALYHAFRRDGIARRMLHL